MRRTTRSGRRSVHLFAVAVAVAAFVGAASASCASPTGIDVEVFSEIPCDANASVVVIGGAALKDLATRAPATTSSRCSPVGDGTFAHGDVVLLPAEDHGSGVALAVLTRIDSESPDQCLEPAHAAGCIVAKRQLGFVPHSVLHMRVDLRRSCLGVTCPLDATCVRGQCTSASVDPNACRVGTCDEATLGTSAPGDGGGPALDAPVSDGTAADASVDTAAPPALDGSVPVGDTNCMTSTCDCVVGQTCHFFCAPGATCTVVGGTGSTVFVDCPAGKCTINRNQTGGQFFYDCNNGGCSIDATGSGLNDVACAGGGCTFVTSSSSTSYLRCAGNGCTMTCTGSGRCELRDCTASCNLKCSSAGGCLNTCTASTCSNMP